MADRTTRLALFGLLLTLALLVPTTAIAADRDGDGLRDTFERKYGVTSPKRDDSDRDGVVDGAEDGDWDKLSNLAEQRFGTDPGNPDTDGDGVRDGAEDHDGDGRRNSLQQDRRPLPANVRPSLASAIKDFGRVAGGCDSALGSSALETCRFGPAGKGGRVVLMGDSHAAVMVDPFQRVARADGWRLTTMLKGGCVPVPGLVSQGQYRLDRGRSCAEWLRKAIAAINKNPPHLVVITSSQSYKLMNDKGRFVPWRRYPALWQDGLKRMLRQMPEGTEVLMLGDVPRNKIRPLDCLRQDPSNMSRCQMRRLEPGERHVEVALRTTSREKGQHFGTLYYKICSYDPCPLVQGDVLVWRDRSHLTGTFARKLTPAVRELLAPYLE